MRPLALVLGFVLIFLAPCRAEIDGTAVEKETFALINKYRVGENLPALKWNDAIAKIAREHSRDMARGDVEFGHGGFRDRIGRLKAIMAGFQGAGENVFMSDQLDHIAGRAVAMWLKSPHHLENIRGDYNYSAIGVWQSKDGSLYFTQIFLKVIPAMEEVQAAPSASMPFALLADPHTR